MTAPEQGHSQGHGDQPIRVLLVDDQQLLRESFTRLLELAGGAVEVVGAASDGAEAVALVERLAAAGRAPQVVLMDVRMPRVNGVEATRQIVARWPQVRVVILSTFDDEEYLVAGLRAGARGYLLKDTSSAELVRAIQAAHRGESPIQPAMAAKLVAQMARGPNLSTPFPAREGGAGPSAAMGGAPHVPAVEREGGDADGGEVRPPLSAPGRGLGGGVPPGGELTEREREILRLIARGASNREISEALFITEGTVKNHVSNILAKLALRDRTQAAVYAHDHGLV
jgi:DNA-binding NarL/FixJ family response regulator